MFDGTGFVRGVQRKGDTLKGARCLMVGSGVAGPPIAKLLVAAGVAPIGLFEDNEAYSKALGILLRAHYPTPDIGMSWRNATGYEVVVDETPLGVSDDEPLPIDVSRIDADAFMGDVVMK